MRARATSGVGEQVSSGSGAAKTWLAMGALGVAFGDIGTSPLYAIREAFVGHHKMAVYPPRIFGVLSIIFWTMILVATLKYVVVMLRADNKGEGGSLALLALISRRSGSPRWTAGLTTFGIIATALFFSDAVLTPAVTMLSAVEGLEVVDRGLGVYVVPASLLLLACLFAAQSRGTERMSFVFGPIMLLYFVVLAGLGLGSIVATPAILSSILPRWGGQFIWQEPGVALFASGSIVLVVTGAEALYARMCEFGRAPIRLAWFTVAFPCLMLNYLGQGALLLRNGGAADNPFFRLAPAGWRLPLILLVSAAAIVASQAVITGAYSMVRQAVQLGLFPRIQIRHTSDRAEGRIYVPLVNWALLVMIVILILTFRTSSKLVSAYGIAVTGAMLISTVMIAVALRRVWRWPLPPVLALVSLLAAVETTYFVGSLLKVGDGGWFPIALAAVMFILLTTWARGRALVRARLRDGNIPLRVLIESLEKGTTPVDGTAVYLTGSTEVLPPSLLHNIKHNKALHHRILLLTASVVDVPRIPDVERVEVQELGRGIARVLLRYGFSEDPDVPATLAAAARLLGPLSPMTTSYFISRQTIIPGRNPGMARWRRGIFAWMVRNSATTMQFFKLPPNRVVELGSQIEI